MTEKLDKLSADILSLLKKHAPKMLRHHEICDSLFPSYQYKYKDKKGFGVAVTQKLKLLKAAGLIKHEDFWYGTSNSDVPSEKKKPSEKEPFKKLSKEEREYLEQRAEFYEDAEWLAETYPEYFKPLKDFADISRKVRKELGLE